MSAPERPGATTLAVLAACGGLVYFAIAGFTGRLVVGPVPEGCVDMCAADRGLATIMVGIIWPISLPFHLGKQIAESSR